MHGPPLGLDRKAAGCGCQVVWPQTDIGRRPAQPVPTRPRDVAGLHVCWHSALYAGCQVGLQVSLEADRRLASYGLLVFCRESPHCRRLRLGEQVTIREHDELALLGRTAPARIAGHAWARTRGPLAPRTAASKHAGASRWRRRRRAGTHPRAGSGRPPPARGQRQAEDAGPTRQALRGPGEASQTVPSGGSRRAVLAGWPWTLCFTAVTAPRLPTPLPE